MSTSISSEYIGPYRLLKVANTGQTSRLWQAYDDENRQYVAIKTLQEKYVHDNVHIAYLKKEYEVAAGLDHQYLIKILKFGIEKRIPYLAMEWCAAPNLKMILNRGYMQIAPYYQQIVPHMIEGLAYLHSKGWIHRDIKPDNFIFTEDADVKLIDFALATKKPSGLSKLFSFGSRKSQGTASYMSPEQIKGETATEQSDIYSFGCTLFELLATRSPYSGGSMNELLQKHISGIVPPVTARNNNLTPEIAEIVKSCLAKNPKDRPKNSTDLAQILKSTRIFKRPPKNSDVNV